MDDRPIGVFDSGLGGLTVARALLDYVLAGSSARAEEQAAATGLTPEALKPFLARLYFMTHAGAATRWSFLRLAPSAEHTAVIALRDAPALSLGAYRLLA